MVLPPGGNCTNLRNVYQKMPVVFVLLPMTKKGENTVCILRWFTWQTRMKQQSFQATATNLKTPGA